jgi:hypothetical protein
LPTTRAIFLIDGFNLYHSVRDAARATAVKLIEVLYSNQCDTAVVMSGDTDIAPAIRVAQRLFPERTVAIAFPFGRKNRELAQLVPISFQIARKQYVRHQFPALVNVSGRAIRKPDGW